VRERARTGKYCFGKSPMQKFLDSTHQAKGDDIGPLMVGDGSDTARLILG